jgi:hypothetical protein
MSREPAIRLELTCFAVRKLPSACAGPQPAAESDLVSNETANAPLRVQENPLVMLDGDGSI